MTAPTKAAMKQLLDERMIAGSASNRLPQAMFFLQLNLSGVIILLSLMFYANALGESFVRGLWVRVCVCVSPFSVVWYRRSYVLWFKVWTLCMRSGVEVVCVWRCLCVALFFKHSENISIPLSPACAALIISCMHQGFLFTEITQLKSYADAWSEKELVLTSACLHQFAQFNFNLILKLHLFAWSQWHEPTFVFTWIPLDHKTSNNFSFSS